MNDKFKSKMKEKGKTAYAVSKETGIPYSVTARTYYRIVSK